MINGRYRRNKELAENNEQTTSNSISPSFNNLSIESENAKKVIDFVQNYSQKSGEEQAAKDIQRGLNLLNKGKKDSLIEAKQKLKEDGFLGEKSLNCLSNVCQNYSLRIVQKYIQRGAINNTIFDTKNDMNINTDEKINEILNNLKIEGSY